MYADQSEVALYPSVNAQSGRRGACFRAGDTQNPAGGQFRGQAECIVI